MVKKPKFRIPSAKVPRRGRTLGKAPGTITYLGEREGEGTQVEKLSYDLENLEGTEPANFQFLQSKPAKERTEWINVIGLSDESAISEIGDLAGLNNLVLEDIVNTQQRPKLDEYDDHIFAVFKMCYLNEARKIVKEHVALVLTPQRVLVFQEVEADVFGGVRSRIEQKWGKIRQRGADYLFFALLDALVDNYLVVLELTEERLYDLENTVFQKPDSDTPFHIQQLRKEINALRRWISPVRELVNRLMESDSPLIQKETRIFLRDVLDHTFEINDTLQIQREMAVSLMDMYMSNVSNRMNEVMKVLTIMASIFIPLTFIAGIYGMNFQDMPELKWEYGYETVWGVMIVTFVGLLIFFKRKGWL